MPIIHTGPTQLGVVNFETQRVHQMEHATRDCAHPTDVTGVGGDLRVEQDKMEGRLHRRRLMAREISRLASRSLIS